MTVSSVLSRVVNRRIEQRKNRIGLWPDIYKNLRTGKEYHPPNEQVHFFISEHKPRYMLLKGGEGGGKSAAGVVKSLNRLRKGESGIAVSSDFEHFKKSLWPAMRDWIPWHCVIERHRYRQQQGWEPSTTFTLVFHNENGGYSELMCGGAKETEIGSWEGPNVNFIHFDEARRHNSAAALKTFDGRARVGNLPPQIYITTTPKKHWLFEYFAGAAGDEHSMALVPEDIQLRYADFKRDAYVATVLTEENRSNLSEGFIEQRRQTLDESEARILLAAQWEDESDIEKFVNIIWWDNCKEEVPPLTRSEPIVISLDAAKGGETNIPDCFAMGAVSRHWSRPQDAALRYCGIWQPQPGQLLDFEPIENELVRLCEQYSVVEVTYDPYQLHDMAMRLKKRGLANFREFKQGIDRLKADKQLQDLIVARRIAHDGNPLLRQHVDNANIKKAGQDGIRLVKRSPSLKIDAAVMLSQGASRCLYYNL